MADDISGKQLMSEINGNSYSNCLGQKLVNTMDDIDNIVVHEEGDFDAKSLNFSETLADLREPVGNIKKLISPSSLVVNSVPVVDDLGRSQPSHSADPTSETKYQKGRKNLNNSFLKHIISGTSCVASSSDLSLSTSIEDDEEEDNTSVDLDDLVYSQTAFKKVGASSKASPKSTQLCWHCSSYASPSSSVSPSSSFDLEDEHFKDFDLPIFYFESKEHLFPDWQSEHSSNSSNSHDNMEDEWADVNSMYDNADDILEEMRQKRSQEAPPLYPHRALLYMDCSVCFVKSYLRRRVCCDFQICPECMSAYVSVKVNEAKVEIECPNDRCNVLVHRDEINERLPSELKEKFAKFLIDANADPCQKTCPACSKAYTIRPEALSKKKKVKYGLKVICGQCSLVWCFVCQAPYHTDTSCKQYKKGNKMVKKWAKERTCGQSNAQKCPKCGIYIQRVHGCDHMKCVKCHTDFCYQCGDRYISIKLLGNHWSRFSPLGCKYRLLPKRPGLRKFIRGTHFAARLVAGVILAGLGLAAGAVLVGASVVIVPGYGIFMLKQHLWRKKQLKRFKKQKLEMIARAERDRYCHAAIFNNQLSSDLLADVRPSTAEDVQQVRVMVHRSVSFSPEETTDIIINKYTKDNTEVTIARDGRNDIEDLLVLSDLLEVENISGYSTIVCNVISKVGHTEERDPENVEVEKKLEDCVAELHNLSLQSNHSLPQTDGETNVILRKSANDCLEKNIASETGSRQDSGFDEGEGHVETTFESDGSAQLSTGLNNQDKVTFIDLNKSNVSEGKITDMTSKNDVKGRDRMKGESNGCFGNIFSKKLQTSAISSEDLNLVPNLSRKFLSSKAATWEKCNGDKLQSLLKLVPLDSKGEMSGGMSAGLQESGLITQGETFNESPPINKHGFTRDLVNNDNSAMSDIGLSTEKTCCFDKEFPFLSSPAHAADQSRDGKLNSKSAEPHFDDIHISHYSLVTYL